MRKLPWKGEARGWGKEVGDIGGWGVSGGGGGMGGTLGELSGKCSPAVT